MKKHFLDVEEILKWEKETKPKMLYATDGTKYLYCNYYGGYGVYVKEKENEVLKLEVADIFRAVEYYNNL